MSGEPGPGPRGSEPGFPDTAKRRPGKRTRRHLLLGLGAGSILVLAFLSGNSAGGADRLSIVTAWLCLGLLGAALLIGPWHVLTRERPVTNDYRRRDLGIWAAFAGLAHFALAMSLSMNYAYLDRFVNEATAPPSPELRYDLYSTGTILGFVIAVFFLLLLALSNDRALRGLGTRWWKRLQRSAYVAGAATVLHGIAFQLLESRGRPLVVLLLVLSAAVLAAQLRAFLRVRRRRLADTTD